VGRGRAVPVVKNGGELAGELGPKVFESAGKTALRNTFTEVVEGFTETMEARSIQS
jgi:hypothetical protein